MDMPRPVIKRLPSVVGDSHDQQGRLLELERIVEELIERQRDLQQLLTSEQRMARKRRLSFELQVVQRQHEKALILRETLSKT